MLTLYSTNFSVAHSTVYDAPPLDAYIDSSGGTFDLLLTALNTITFLSSF